MKKKFQKPVLSRCEIRLNENIAHSWEYYYGGDISATYHFTYSDPKTGLPGVTEIEGCFTYLTDNTAWNTNNYSGPNVGILMADYLLHNLLVAAYNENPSNHYITDCYKSALPIS